MNRPGRRPGLDAALAPMVGQADDFRPAPFRRALRRVLPPVLEAQFIEPAEPLASRARGPAGEILKKEMLVKSVCEGVA